MKSRIINNTIELLNLNAAFIVDIVTGEKLYHGSVKYMSDEQISEQGFKEEVIPEYDSTTHQLGCRIIVDDNITFAVVEKSVQLVMFDVSKFKDDLKIELGARMLDLYPMYSVILDNLKTPMLDEHYLTIKFFMNGWLQKGDITQDDYNKFVKCFSNQNIDIINYSH